MSKELFVDEFERFEFPIATACNATVDGDLKLGEMIIENEAGERFFIKTTLENVSIKKMPL